MRSEPLLWPSYDNLETYDLSVTCPLGALGAAATAARATRRDGAAAYDPSCTGWRVVDGRGRALGDCAILQAMMAFDPGDFCL